MTAVEWLVEQLSNYDSKMVELFKNEIKQAKEIEKQQITDFTNEFIEKHTFGDYEGMVQKNKTVQQYYNETFKTNKI